MCVIRKNCKTHEYNSPKLRSSKEADPATESYKGSGDSLDDWQEDPGDMIFEDSDTGQEGGRTRRKRTFPCLPGVRRKV